MGYILSILLLILIGCNNQSGKQQLKIDTVKLFDPNPQIEEVEAIEADIYKQNIVLTQPDYSINFNNQVHKFSNLFRVGEFIKSNREEIIRSKFYLIADRKTSFERINSVIKILVENKIKDYKVIKEL